MKFEKAVVPLLASALPLAFAFTTPSMLTLRTATSSLRTFTSLASPSPSVISSACHQPSRWLGRGGATACHMSAVAEAKAPPTSAIHPNYQIIKEDYVKEFGAMTTLYRHLKSGAEVLSVQIDDDNKVFGATFRTPPEDSTGVPHILEHSVLCGSRNFPVKEPFVDLLKGSLQTFLNAFTYPDRTCYPVASQNTKDFYNLIHVYLDAVLFPRAVSDPLVMEQEGWHYELEKAEDPLTYKGVVYNEMKGVYSSPDSVMNRATQQALFPENAYSVDSGGDPNAIPDLTFDYFKGFHSRYYHPANSRIFFYGDDDPAKRLELLDSYLKEFDVPDQPAKSAVDFQPLKQEPWYMKESFPAGEESADKHMVSVNWVMNDKPLSTKEKLAIDVLDHLLCGTPASILRRTLEESGLGASFIGYGVDDTLLQHTFSAGLKSVAPDDVPKVEALVLDTLKTVAAEGFEQEAVEAAVNTIEFRLREFNTGSFPRGLSFMLGAMQNWIYDQPPTEALHFEAPLQALKDDLASGSKVFEGIIHKMLLDNGHRATVEMVPDLTLEQKQVAAEEGRLARVKEGLSNEEVEAIIQATQKLKDAQAAEDSAEAKASLPRLSLEDLDKKVKEIPIEESEVDGVKVLTHDIPSNGILYLDVGLDLTVLPLEDLTLLPLFTRMLKDVGTSELDRVALDRKIGTHTGGISASFSVDQGYTSGGKVSDPSDVNGHLFVRGKCVVSKIDMLFGLVNDILADAKLDNQQRVLELLKQSMAGYQSSVLSSGHSFAASRLDARYTTSDYIDEMTGGISYIETLKTLTEQAEKDWPSLLARLEGIRDKLLSKAGMLINLTADQEVLDAAKEPMASFIGKVPSREVAPQRWEVGSLLPVENEAFVVPTQVNYVGKGGRLVEPGEAVSGSAQVVNKFLRTGYLWDNVRVMGGAYGGFSRWNPISGTFSYLSYRDPNLKQTLDIYDATADYLSNLEMTEDELTQTIIGTIGELDSPMSADQKGFISLKRYLAGSTTEDRQRTRDQILSTTTADFKEFGEKLASFNEKAGVATVTSQNALEAANSELGEEQKLTGKNPL